jgi:hypothetical protein
VRTALLTCIAATALAFGGVIGVADAHTRHKHDHKHHTQRVKHASFDGSCEFSGAVEFTPPMTSTPQPTAQHADAPGTCSGTFVDRSGRKHQLDNAAARYRAESSGDQVSCEFGTATGAGTLTFPDGEIAFAMNEYRGGATPLIHLTGKAGGRAWMPVTPSQGSDPVAALQACNGAGLDHFDLDAHMRTMGPLSG